MIYNKPHLSYAKQLALLQSRGLTVRDEPHALETLRQIGYYRFSAYVYPFRKLLEVDKRPESKVQYRQSAFLPGHTFEEGEALYFFDEKLRMLLLEGLRDLELTLRSQVAYVLGARDAFGHLNNSSLNLFTSRNQKVHADWLVKYQAHYDKAKNSSDFVRHFVMKYESKLPIWVAVEILDFGAITRLFEVMIGKDRSTIAASFGVKTGERLDNWFQSLNYLRNACAHHRRTWNAGGPYEIGNFAPPLAGPELAHVATAPDPDDKLYRRAAVLAYLLKSSDATSDWAARFRAASLSLPAIIGLSAEASMGFPSNWTTLPIWA